MATFDQLPAEQRAIIELVVARGRSYDALADVLQISPQRVRELAHEALVELSPRTGNRVDPEWRGQVADYLLKQQSSADTKSTRGHLKQSESARTWALSVLDALDMLYENGSLPTVPEPGDEPEEEPARTSVRERDEETEAGAEVDAAADEDDEVEEKRPPRRDRERAGKTREREGKSRERDGKTRERDGKTGERDGKTRERDGKARQRDGKSSERDGKSGERDGKSRERDGARAGGKTRERGDTRERDRKRERDSARATGKARDRDRDKGRDDDKDRDDDKKPVAGRSALSPAAQSAVKRRRILGGVGALALLAAIVLGVLALTGAFSGDDGGSKTAGGGDENPTTLPGGGTDAPAQPGAGGAQGQPKILGQVPLESQGGVKAQGVAYLLEQGNQRVLAVTAKLPPLPPNQRRAAYNVWLYNSPSDAASLGAQFTNPKGNYQGVGPLPENAEKFKFIDVSVQPFNRKAGHSGTSVLRGALADLKPVPANQQPGAQQPGGGAQPAP